MVQTCNDGAAARIKPAPSHEDSNWWADKSPACQCRAALVVPGVVSRCSGTVLMDLRTIRVLSIRLDSSDLATVMA
jgi:hypothetical protein